MNSSSRQGTATLAVLIDADNAAPAIVEGLLAEVAKYGVAAVKRIYGDWTKPNLAGWKERLLSHSIQPIQQFRYTVGKNATDSAMIIDAMDLLYTGRFDGFCIVSSDSDFTRLASRIREQGLMVYGFGERKTPKPFVTACDKFIYSDVLRAETEVDETNAPTRRRSGGELRQDSRLVRLLQSAAQAVSDEEGWTTLGSMGTHIAKQAPEFDSRNYGYGKLSELVAATGLFDVETRNGGNNKTLWVRLKRRSRQGEGEGRGSEKSGQQRPAGEQHGGGRHGNRPDSASAGNEAMTGTPPIEEAPAATPAPADEPARTAAAQTEATDVQSTTVEMQPVEMQPVEPTPSRNTGARGRRTSRRPEVKLSETPWPIDSAVLSPVNLDTEAMHEQPATEPESAPEPAPEPAAAPARRTRSAAPRKRSARKTAKTETPAVGGPLDELG